MRLRCRAHNQYAAECTFGVEFMRNKREQARHRAAQAKARTRAEAHALAQEKARAKTNSQTQPLEDGQPQMQAHDQTQPSSLAPAPAQNDAATDASEDLDVTPWLRALGYNAVKARRGAELCAHIPDAPLQERLRVALKGLAPHCVVEVPHVTNSPA
jgi:hypothetical protein